MVQGYEGLTGLTPTPAANGHWTKISTESQPTQQHLQASLWMGYEAGPRIINLDAVAARVQPLQACKDAQAPEAADGVAGDFQVQQRSWKCLRCE